MSNRKAFLLSLTGRCFLFGCIGFLFLSAYSKTIDFLPRADQWHYLANTCDDRSFSQYCFSHYDYNYTRIYNKGDELDFKPLFFFLLGLQNWLYQSHYVYWNITSLAIFILICWALLRLLLKFKKDLAAYIFTAFFAVTFSNFELASWHHINPNGLSIACLLFAIGNIIKLTKSHKMEWALLWKTSALMILAAWLWFPSLLFSAGFSSYAILQLFSNRVRHRLSFRAPGGEGGEFNKNTTMTSENSFCKYNRGAACILIAPVFIYAASFSMAIKQRSLAHLSSGNEAEESGPSQMHAMAGPPMMIESFFTAGELFSQWGQVLLYPQSFAYETHFYTRPMFYTRPIAGIDQRPSNGSFVLNDLLVVIIAILSTWGLCRAFRSFEPFQFIMIILLTVLGYFFLLAYIRLSSHGKEYLLKSCSYDAVIFNALICVMAYVLCVAERSPSKIATILYGLSALLALNLTFHHYSALKLVVGQQYNCESAARRHFQKIQAFVDSKKLETDFTFLVQPDIFFLISEGYPSNTKGHLEFSCSKALFPRYWKTTHSKYKLNTCR